MTDALMIHSANREEREKKEARHWLGVKWMSQNAQRLLEQHISTYKLIWHLLVLQLNLSLWVHKFFSAWVTGWFFRAASLLIVYFKQDRCVQWVPDLMGCMSTWNSSYLKCCNASSVALGHKERCSPAECNTMRYHEPLNVEQCSCETCESVELSSVGLGEHWEWSPGKTRFTYLPL